MLDIKFVRENRELVISKLNKRNGDFTETINNLIEKDSIRRECIKKSEDLKSQMNDASKKVGVCKKNGDIENMQKAIDELGSLSAEIKVKENLVAVAEKEFCDILYAIPNIPLDDVPVGKSDADNKVIKVVGNPKQFTFKIKDHVELGENLGILNFDIGAKITGARFSFLKGYGAKLERALINFMLETHTSNGYEEVWVPFLANAESLFGTGQLPKFEEDLFKCKDDEFYLIPTAEVPITNIHRKEILDSKDLPKKYVGYTPCFRREAGSYGRDTRGLIRNHQFNKVEIVKLVRPEDAENELQGLLADACKILDLLELPYRVVCLSTGDLGFSSAKTYDIEVWMPFSNTYREISSCSIFTDFQARRLNIKYKDSSKNEKDNKEFVNTLNGSGLAVGRTFAAILENYQLEDGSVELPKILSGYMNNLKILTKSK
jgi:seryl-tRNA synthetase